MGYTFNETPTTDLDDLRVIIGDTRFDDGPAPDHQNLEDGLLARFLERGGSPEGAAVFAFEHLAALWISRPVFGPGELSTIHTNHYDKFMKAADYWRGRSNDIDVIGVGTVVSVGSFNRVDGYSDDGSEYT